MITPPRTALVTGASAGIGTAFARLLAAEGHTLLLTARRADRLTALASQLSQAHGVRCEVFVADLADPAAPAELVARAQALGLPIDILVNNAGFSGTAAFGETPWPSLAAEIQVMLTAPTELCHLVLPGMRGRGWGRIVNVSSLSAFSPPVASLLYTGIKSYLVGVSQALDMELKPQGIHVTALCPGYARTEFHDVMGPSSREAADALPAILWQQPDAVVREGWAAVMKGKPVCVPGFVNKLIGSVSRPLPIALQYLIGRRMNPFV